MQTVTLVEVIAAARARQASLVPESAGYLMLALGRAMAGLALHTDPALVLLSTEGAITLAGSRIKLPGDKAAEQMRELLAQLLEVSQGLPGALENALHPQASGAQPVSEFFAAVTRALIPINRGAAKRALARLARETLRAVELGTVAAAPPPPPPAADAQQSEAPPQVEMDLEEEEYDIDVDTPTPSPIIATIELATPTPHGLRDKTPSPVVATVELSPTPGMTEVDATPSAAQETKPYAFEVRSDQVAVGAVSPSTIVFDAGDVSDIDAAIEAVRQLSPIQALPVAPSIVCTPAPTELEIVERVKHAAQERALARRKAHVRGARKRTRLRANVVADKAPDLDKLLAGFATDPETDAVAEAAAGLQRMVALELTPPPPAGDQTPSQAVARDSESGPVALSPNAPCRTPADTLGDVEEERTIPPVLAPYRRSMKRPLVFSAGLLVAGVCSAGIVQLRRHQVAPSAASETAMGATARCLADIELTGLPSPHEILLRLGEAPLRTRPLPTGVRLELVALAPEHRPLRLLVPADASWQDVMSTRVLRLDAKLDRGSLQPWPDAPGGEVGGVGPSGVIDIDAQPKGAELWLVVGAGGATRARVTLDCDSEARLLVVATSDPITQRRLHVPVELLRAAAESGAAQVSVGM